MTIQTTLLEARLAHAVAKAQQAVMAGSAGGDAGHLGFDLPAGLVADVQRTLRRFTLLQRERAAIESAIAAAAAEQRRPEQSRLASFDADVARLLDRAARLAFLLRALRQRRGEPAVGDAAQAVQYLGSVCGRTLDSALVQSTVQQLGTRPMGALQAVQAVQGAATMDTLFIALALVVALAPRGGVAA